MKFSLRHFLKQLKCTTQNHWILRSQLMDHSKATTKVNHNLSKAIPHHSILNTSTIINVLKEKSPNTSQPEAYLLSLPQTLSQFHESLHNTYTIALIRDYPFWKNVVQGILRGFKEFIFPWEQGNWPKLSWACD